MAILLILGLLCIAGGITLAVFAFLPLIGQHNAESGEELPGDEQDGQ